MTSRRVTAWGCPFMIVFRRLCFSALVCGAIFSACSRPASNGGEGSGTDPGADAGIPAVSPDDGGPTGAIDGGADGGSLGLQLPPDPATLLDSDCDGLTDAEEFANLYPGGKQTNANNPDSDGDGILDGVE